MTRLKRILVFRFSSMGDVAMTAPVLKALVEQNNTVELLIVSRSIYKPFFEGIPNSKFIGVNLTDYKGIFGLIKLASQLIKYNPTHIADLHNVLRTKILKFFLRLPSATLDKGREEKKELTRRDNKVLKPLKHSCERYADVFRELGLNLILDFKLKSKTLTSKDTVIGIAPFATYQEKMFPIERMKNITIDIASRGVKIFLFGGGKREIEILKNWGNLHPNIKSIAGKIPLHEELKLIENLNLMISMDSSNMHLASLVNTPTVSIWGGTHPYAGFLGYGQSENNVIQSNVDCRPCSIFGNKKCFKKSYECFDKIEDKQIINHILKLLKIKD